MAQEIEGVEHVVCYASKTLSKTQRNYDTTKREYMSLFHFVKHFRPYLYGQKFKIVTDH